MTAASPARKARPWWQQATALVTVSTGGVITGLNFAPGTPATMTSPNGLPMHLMALDMSGKGDLGGATANGAGLGGTASGDATLRPAIVNVARHYLHVAQTKTPAEMEALIWGAVSTDGTDHGPSCAAFASLTLELAAQAVGQQSWVTGGDSYPWPVHSWADPRVDPNPDSLTVTSVAQDAQAHARWHPLGDGYTPLPGDWVLFHEHVEVVTSYTGGVLHTIGANSLPGYTVNAHTFSGSLAGDGVRGFVNNGNLATTTTAAHPAPTPQSTPSPQSTPKPQSTPTPAPSTKAKPAAAPNGSGQPSRPAPKGQPDIPGLVPVPQGPTGQPGAPPPKAAQPKPAPPKPAQPKPARSRPSRPTAPRPPRLATVGQADIPGLVSPGNPAAPTTPAATPPSSAKPPASARPPAAKPAATTSPKPSARKPYSRQSAPPAVPTPATGSQAAFIAAVAPGAMAAQQRWGVPAAVTIAQAIEESAWGQSSLSATYHNLFGIKGTGPAGSVLLPTQEFEGGQWVTVDQPFRVYHNVAESISDHAALLATSGYYTRAMADRGIPDAFASDLTGVYATDPHYGGNLIALMKLYNLYQYDAPVAAHAPASPTPAPATPTPHATASPQTTGAPHATPTPQATTPAPSATPTSPAPQPTHPSPQPSQPSSHPTHPAPQPTQPAATTNSPTPAQPSIPGLIPVPGPTQSATPAPARARPSQPARTRAAAATSAPAQPSIPGLVPVPGTQPGYATTTSYPTASYGPPAGRAATAGGASGVAGASAVASAATMAFARPKRRAAPRPQPPRPERIYDQDLPEPVQGAFLTSAMTPIAHSEPLYKDIAGQAGISWKLLAACDWMQCQAQPHLSPVHGERLGTPNPDGTVYTTKSAALAQCATDLIELALAVYGIDLTVPRRMSVQALADAFAAFRWGGLLRKHRVSSMEFPYSVEGLTAGHLKMRWPNVDEPNAPDKPGTKFKLPFGAVPVVLSLNYRPTV